METAFQFNKFVTGKNFIGRKRDCAVLAEYIAAGEHVVIAEPIKTGKMSLVRQVLSTMSAPPVAVYVNMVNVREIEQFITVYRNATLTAFASSTAEREALSARYASDFAISGPESMDDVLTLPFRICRDTGRKAVIIFEEFQTIRESKNPDELLYQPIARTIDTYARNTPCVFIFLGSRCNAMDGIFGRGTIFWKRINRLSLSEITEAEITEHILKGFSISGKVVDRELLHRLCSIFRNNIWYINHFFFICDSLSKGYISEITFKDSLSAMLAVHSPRFYGTMDSLTEFQIRFLKAVCDGVVKFSTSQVMEEYDLSSSANVIRLKTAMMRKEILVFGENDEPRITDPLFEYWLKKFYFV